MAIKCRTGRWQHSNRRILQQESIRQKLYVSMLLQWIFLILLAFPMLYRDTVSITGCFLIYNREATTTDMQKYLSSVVESFSSSRSGVFSLRGTSEDAREKRYLDSSIAPSHQKENNISTISSDNSGNFQNLTSSCLRQKKSSSIPDSNHRATLSANDGNIKPSIKPAAMREKFILTNFQSTALNRASTISPGNSTDDIVKVLCLSGEPYGRTMNQYIQLAVILHQLGVNGTSVVAFKNPYFSRFFKEWFDARDDVWVDYDENAPCDAEYDATTLHYLFFEDKWKQVAYQFKTLIPKTAIRAQAEMAMKEYGGPRNVPVTTVHRRDLEGACVLFAEQKNLIACPNTLSSSELDVMDFKNACLMDYSMIANETQGTEVVLFTDGQVPDLDQTFPIISDHPFPVQSWMMATSVVHYGNPFSTVDVVVYYWRKALAEQSDVVGEMRPSACYRPTPNE
jgi:hypothetical protein